jgi:hypothetical protein
MSSALTITEIATVAVAANSLSGGGITNALGFGGGGGGQVGGGSGAGVAAAADPFAGYRSNLATMYAGALQPGAEIDPTQMPGYTQYKTGVMDPSLEASKRSAAASGMLRSGNEQIALEQTAQKGYYGFMTDYLNRLAQGSGATQNPATAVGMGVNQGNLNNQGIMQGFGAGLTTLAGAYGKNNNPTYSTPTGSTNTFESDINTNGFYDTAPSDINMSGFYNAP